MTKGVWAGEFCLFCERLCDELLEGESVMLYCSEAVIVPDVRPQLTPQRRLLLVLNLMRG